MLQQPEVGSRGAETRRKLVNAMLDLVQEGGMPAGASVRSIARRAGVTEAVLYRYFPNKDAMFREVWGKTMSPMIEAKVALLANENQSPVETLRDWIQITYEHYDTDPARFHYVFLSEGTVAWRSQDEYQVQSCAMLKWLGEAVDVRALAPMSLETALAFFAAMLLAVPTRLGMGDAVGDATDYVNDVLEASVRLFRLDE